MEIGGAGMGPCGVSMGPRGDGMGIREDRLVNRELRVAIRGDREAGSQGPMRNLERPCAKADAHPKSGLGSGPRSQGPDPGDG
jgi:hypothetical protein